MACRFVNRHVCRALGLCCAVLSFSWLGFFPRVHYDSYRIEESKLRKKRLFTLDTAARCRSQYADFNESYFRHFPNIPLVVSSFNNPTFVIRTVEQGLCFTGSVIIVDNNSTFPPLIKYFASLPSGVVLHRMFDNLGPYSAFLPEVFDSLPEYFALTDADLLWNSRLPHDAFFKLASATKFFGVPKVGFSLEIPPADDVVSQKIAPWEMRFWVTNLEPPPFISEPAYSANIDTTFALYNKPLVMSLCTSTFHMQFMGKKICNNMDPAVRIGGLYTARHLPWYRSYLETFDKTEFVAAYCGKPKSGVGSSWAASIMSSLKSNSFDCN
jgi:hypothetical protein